MTGSAVDPFPTEPLTRLVRRLPRYARLAWRLSRDPRLSRGRRAAVIAAAAYLVSPIDLVPGIVPVAGQLDDAAVGLMALRFALRGLRPEDRSVLLASAKLSHDELNEDLATVRQATGWLLRRGRELGAKAGRAAARRGVDATRMAMRRVWR